jgi:hypothetical protein
MDIISNIAGPSILPAPGAKPGEPDPSRLVREHENDFPEIRKVNEQIDEYQEKKNAVEELLTLPRDERLEGIRKGAPELYKPVHQAFVTREKSTAFRVCAGIWLAGLAVSVGALVSSFTGGVPGTVVSMSFPLTMGLGTGISHLYLAAAKKWRLPGKEDAWFQTMWRDKEQRYDNEIARLKEKKEEMLAKHIQGQQEVIDGASSLNAGDDRVKVDDNFIEIDGIRLQVSKKMQYTVIPVSAPLS